MIIDLAEILAISIPIVGFYILYKIVEVKTRARTHNKMIDILDKLNLSEVNQIEIAKMFEQTPNTNKPLRIACILGGVGLGILLAWILQVCYPTLPNIEVIYIACSLLFGGLTFLGGFLLERKLVKKDK